MEVCHSIHCPVYHAVLSPRGESISPLTDDGEKGSLDWVVRERKDSKGAVKTAATSLGLRRGISESSTDGICGQVEMLRVAPFPSFVLLLLVVVVVVVGCFISAGSASIQAIHGRTPSSVRARWAGSWHKCWIRNGGGNAVSTRGSPISSKASRRAVCIGVSWSVSAFPPGRAA